MEGIGVHSGKTCKISINPAPCDSGISHVRDGVKIAANYANVSDTNMCTRITDASSGVTVSLIEHISAAFYGLGISNAVVQLLEGDEIPFMDGSAIAFVQALEEAGIDEQSKERKKLRIKREVKVGDAKRWALLCPPQDDKQDSLTMRAECDFSEKGLSTIPFSYDFSSDNFRDAIAPARTFGFFSDVEYLRKNHLALGSSMDNTLVFGEGGKVINPEGMRCESEPVVHKVLDAIGDLSLSGYEVVGFYNSFCPGHGLNNALLRELFKDSENYYIE